MSLVNDALKRATEADKKKTASTKPSLQLRPIEPLGPPRKPAGPAFLVTLLVLAAAGVSGFVFLKPPVKARSPAPQTPAFVAEPVSQNPVHSATILSEPAKIEATNSAPISPVQVATLAPVPAPPAPLRLQAVFFSPARPSAIINGHTVYVGDRVREMEVIAIGTSSAMLIGAGQTNLLTLAD